MNQTMALLHHNKMALLLLITRAADIFTLPNEDSGQELVREVELINMMGSYINRNRLLLQINGVYIFPQTNNVHNLK